MSEIIQYALILLLAIAIRVLAIAIDDLRARINKGRAL